MRKYAYIIVLALIVSAVYFTSCERIPKEMMDMMMPDAEQIEPPPEMVEPPPEMTEMPVDLVNVLIYTNRSFWITLEDAAMAAETTKRLLDAAGVQVEITKNDAYVREWMRHTTGDGNMNVIVLYGVLPASVYGTGNTQPDGSIAENWIETTDGDTILNHADYIAFNTDYDVDKVTEWTPDNANQAVGSNGEGGLQNLMDNPNINLFTALRAGGGASMIVTSDGLALTPSLANFDSLRPIPLSQLQGEWFAEKVFASDTGNAEATYADPVILRDGDLGRLAIVHATTEYEGLLNGEVAAEIIINYLLAPPMMETVETPDETMVEMEPETTETPMEPAETTDLIGEMVDIEDAMSTIGLRKIYWTDDDSLLRANPDGSGVETLFDRRPDLEPSFGVRKLVVDSEGGKIYWNGDESADRGGGVWRANLDGTNLERLTTTQARGFALDLEADKIYWVTYDGDHIFHRSNLDGSGVEKFNTHTILGLPSIIEFDPVDRKIYASLSNYSGVSVINTDDLDIEEADIESQLPISGYRNLTLDIEERKIYWVTDSSGVYRMNLDGTNYEFVMDEGRIAATFDFNTRKIYWANKQSAFGAEPQIVWQTNLDGSDPEGLFAVDFITGIAVETGPIN